MFLPPTRYTTQRLFTPFPDTHTATLYLYEIWRLSMLLRISPTMMSSPGTQSWQVAYTGHWAILPFCEIRLLLGRPTSLWPGANYRHLVWLSHVVPGRVIPGSQVSNSFTTRRDPNSEQSLQRPLDTSGITHLTPTEGSNMISIIMTVSTALYSANLSCTPF